MFQSFSSYRTVQYLEAMLQLGIILEFIFIQSQRDLFDDIRLQVDNFLDLKQFP